MAAWGRIADADGDSISNDSDTDGDFGVQMDLTDTAAGKPARLCMPWTLAVVVTLTLGFLGMLGASNWHQESIPIKTMDMSNLQEVDPPPAEGPQGGTLEPGPGCPSACGSFVACSLNASSENNLYPVDLFQTFGLFPFPDGLKPTIALNRLFNKQLVPFTADFQCPGTDCFIPNAFVNDDFCDCPINCSDEIAHSCESCGADLVNSSENVVAGVGCPNFCGGLNDASNINCLGTGASTLPRFSCPDSACEIDGLFVDDNRCDCPFTCADETNWTCDNCSCPSICGVAVFDCDGSGLFTCPKASNNQTCVIPGDKVGNGICDCPETCEDEASYPGPPLDCNRCTCPTACGQSLEVIGTCVFEQILSIFPPFDCGNGCLIPGGPSFFASFVNDGVCDCPGNCADEFDTGWTCETCNCPTTCLTARSNVVCGEPYFQCPDSDCKVPVDAINDNACNCPGCEDEKDWTCETCDLGCPFENVCYQRPPCRAAVFECGQSSERCALRGTQVNNNICDCPNCEDEEFWDCSNCTCPTICGIGAVPCGTLEDRLLDTPIQCPGSVDPVTPDGECAVTPALLQNNRCDCPGRCVDEVLDFSDPRSFRFRPPIPNDPNTCICQRNDNLQPAQCPQSCGEIVEECPFRCEPRISSGFEVPCHVPSSAIKDGRCDCPAECDDEEGSFTCNSFDPAPNTDECFCFSRCLGSIELDLSPCPGSFTEGFCKNLILINGPSVCEFIQDICAEYCPPQTASLNSGVAMVTPKMREEIEALHLGPAEKLLAVALNQTQKALRSPAPHSKQRTQAARRAERKLSESLPFGSSGVRQGILECEAAIEEAMTSLPRRGSPEAWQEALKRSFADGATGGSVAKAFEGSGEGPTFTDPMRHAVIHDALEMLLTPPKDREQKAQATFSKEFRDGSKAEQALLDTRALNKPRISTKAKQQNTEGDVNFVDEILSDLIFTVYLRLNEKNEKSKTQSTQSHVNAGRRMQGFGPGELSNALASALRPADAFDCPDVQGCALPRPFVNDRKCDCPDTCADEDAFTCETCIPTVPFGIVNPAPTATDIGVAVGVSLGVGIGVGLGVGLGLASGIGAVFIAQGLVQFTVMNAEEFTSSPEVQQGMKRAFLRLAGLEIAENAVKLNWACAAQALSQITAKLRRLGEKVTLCFEIEIEGETKSMDACKVLSSTSPGGAQKVIKQELLEAGADDSIELVNWEPDPNPKSFNPNTDVKSSMPFSPINKGFNLG